MKLFMRFFYPVLGGAAVLLGIYAFWSYRATAELQKRIEVLQAEHMPISIRDLQREPPANEEENAAEWLRRAQTGLESIDKEVFVDRQLLSSDQPLSAENALQIMEILDAHRGALDLVHKAANCPRYDPAAGYDGRATEFIEQVTKRLQLLRSAHRALQCEALVQLRIGKPRESLATTLDMLRLGELVRAEPTLVAFLVRNAVAALALQRVHDLLLAELTADEYQQIEAALAKLDIAADFQNALATERAFAIDSIDQLHEFSHTLPISPLVKTQAASLIDLLNTAYDSATLDLAQSRQRLEAGQRRGAFAQMTLPAVQAAADASARTRALISTLRIHTAIRAQHVRNIADLKIEIPDEVWLDPFNGKRLKAVLQNGNWVVYSVGRNGNDDGGEVDPKKMADVGWIVPAQPE